MPSVHLVKDAEKDLSSASADAALFPWMGWAYLLAGSVLLAMIGTWLVWFFASTQLKLQAEEIRSACQRIMPETADRCFDTVVIQRGGVRR